MRLITWNIQWGVGADQRFDLARIVTEAKRLADFDVLCLQEVADNFPELKGGPREDQFAELARLLPGYTAVEGIGVDVPAADGSRKRFGNIVLSRYPVGQVLRHALAWEADDAKSMPRLLIEAVVAAPFGSVRVMTTHLEYFSAPLRAASVESIRAAHRQACARVLRPPRPADNMFRPHPGARSAILVGDFNMRPEDPSLARLLQPFEDGAPAFRDAWTVHNAGAPHPVSFCLYEQVIGPPHCCDYALITEDLAPRLRGITYDQSSRASDHQSVIIELDDR
jgi:endonuclease/exonuclease/phosphatase family metal-dependent hydrolase